MPGASAASTRSDRMESQAPPRSMRRFDLIAAFMRILVRSYSRTAVEGIENLPAGPAVLCFNHQNWADPIFMLGLMPRRPRFYFFGPEQEEMRSGVRNRMMRWGGVVIPFRPGRRGLLWATARSAELLAGGSSVAIAGEGRIHSGEGAILPLQDGPAYLSLRVGVPLVPVALNGTGWLAFRRKVRLRIGLPIMTASRVPGRPGAVEVAELTARTQSQLEALVADFADQPVPGPVGRWLTERFNDWPEGGRPEPLRPRAG
jgi:1-acyl-sn-glycerol-3-phosphate acyltransferase